MHRQPWFYHKIACHFASLEVGKLYIVRKQEHDEFGFSRGSIPELTLESRKSRQVRLQRARGPSRSELSYGCIIGHDCPSKRALNPP
jgi:hypothetical protein